MKLLLLSLFTIVTSNFASNYTTEANNMSNHFKNNFGGTITKPGTENTPFTTIDGSKNFSSRITCNTSKVPIAKISYSGISDILINLEIDTNADGNVDKYSTISNVSGICSDGVVKCNTNTWNNCSYYKYQYSVSSGFSLVSVPGRLENCYCINSSCGNKSAHYKSEILNDIAGSIYATMSASLSSFVLTRTEADANQVQIYGENPDQCKNYQQGSKNFNQNTIASDGEALFAQQSQDLNSPAYITRQAATHPDMSATVNNIKTTHSARINSIQPASENNKLVTVDGFGITDLSSMEIVKEPQFCQVVKYVPNAQIYTDNTTSFSSNTSNISSETYDLRECIGDNFTICPYESNEQIKYDCGKVRKDGFNAAVSGMKTIEEMTKDFTCSND